MQKLIIGSLLAAAVALTSNAQDVLTTNIANTTPSNAPAVGHSESWPDEAESWPAPAGCSESWPDEAESWPAD